MGRQPFVFVCYAHSDSVFVYPEITRLQDQGFRIWYDDGIAPGSEWTAAIAEAIETCEVFLYFITPKAVASEHCRREVNFALEQSCRMLAVHLVPTDVPSALKLSLSHRQAILKYDQPPERYASRLAKALKDAEAGHVDDGAGLARALQIGDVVVDNVVHQVIGRLRRTFGDSARDPHYIETLPRRGYRLLKQVGPLEVPPRRREGLLATNPLRQRSGELQLISNLDGPFNFVAGLFYLDLERDLYVEFADSVQLGLYTGAPSWGLIDPGDFFPPPRGPGRWDLGSNEAYEVNYCGGTPNGAWFWSESENTTESHAAYVQANYELRPEWELTAGIRWSKDCKIGREWRWIYSEFNAEFAGFESLTEFNRQITTDPITGAYNGDPLRLAGFPIELIDSLRIDDSWEKLTWRLALSWTPTEQKQIYASATTGYRSGGFNLRLHQEFPYDEEENLAYEVGVKTDLLDGRLRLNVSSYLYR